MVAGSTERMGQGRTKPLVFEGLHFRPVPAVSTFIGSNFCRRDDFPMVRVVVGSFHIADTTVTQRTFEEVMGWNPSYFRGADLPVTNVSHFEAVAFCNRMSELHPGTRFRLPLEAEWEHAARGGTQAPYAGSHEIDAVAWHIGNSGRRPHPVARKQANGYGLHDMCGNVWEWCEDWYRNRYANRPWPLTPAFRAAARQTGGNNKVVRGGCFLVGEDLCAVNRRSRRVPEGKCSYVGFRPALDLIAHPAEGRAACSLQSNSHPSAG